MSPAAEPAALLEVDAQRDDDGRPQGHPDKDEPGSYLQIEHVLTP